MKKLRVAVLMGGPSPERDVSLGTGEQIVAALDPQRYSVLPVEITKDGKWLPRPEMVPLPAPSSAPAPGGGLAAAARRVPGLMRGRIEPAPTTYDRFVEREQVDVAFIAMHGPYGEDGTMQGLLELLGIPYTGSGVLASALAMDKLRSRQIFEWHRLPVPGYLSVSRNVWRDRAHVHHQVETLIGYPCVVKPNAVGSSIGISLVRDAQRLEAAVKTAFGFGPIVLVEEYVAGVEITCGIVDDPDTGEPVPLPLVEIVPHADFYDYDAKYAAGGSDHIIPARVSEDVSKRAQALAVRAYQALGCEGMSRVDMIARETDIVVLEVNTIPGMTATSLLPDAAKAAGISFPDLLDRIIRSSLRRSQR
ncbi:MAG TPA: D-alanine--D-alanine ligase [bacterium]|nr:D-alanine--D-alanine ligase [bacterium]